ncbi:MAG: T9SS type A sorting domain-containing protein [Bacteroidetes bacterium]|nr:T9SS type A sorting domain-containing protein [Bacteroidota bacterium]
MKRFTIILGFMLCISLIYSQSPRMVLHEEFTQSNCGPCASVNPTFHTWLGQHPDIYTQIFYHVWWPGANNDPMYLANTVDNGARTGMYGVAAIGVPYAVIDGDYWLGVGGYLQWSTIDTRSQVPSPFEIHYQHMISAGHDSIYLTMLAKATSPITASTYAENVVIEKHIHYTTAPGTNGEKDFYQVMKKMLPTSAGTILPSTMATGDYVLLENNWKFANVYDYNEIAAVSFIQDKNTKEVYQAANSSTDAIVMPYNNDLQVMDVLQVPAATCNGNITPIIKIRNNGNTAVSSFHLKYQVNDGTVGDFSWSGNITTLQKAYVALPEINFTPLLVNTLKVYSVDPNNVNDEYPKNDTIKYFIDAAPLPTTVLNTIIMTDNNPEQTTWNVKASNGTVIKAAGPYTQANHAYRDEIDLPVGSGDCYTFTIHDSGGNGLCCANGGGSYMIYDPGNNDNIILQGSVFTDSAYSQFKIVGVGVDDNPGSSQITIHPNPFMDETTISLFLSTQSNITMSIFNLTGQLVRTEITGILKSGNHDLILKSNGLAPGIYLLKVQTCNKVFTKKITIGN